MDQAQNSEEDLIWWEDGCEEEVQQPFGDDRPERAIIALATTLAPAPIDAPGSLKPGLQELGQ